MQAKRPRVPNWATADSHQLTKSPIQAHSCSASGSLLGGWSPGVLGGHRLLLSYKLSVGMLLWAVQQELKEQSEVGVLLVAAAPGKTALKTCGICYSLCNSSLERCYIVLHIKKVWRVALREKNSPLRKELLPTACYHPCCSSDLSRSPEVHIGGCLPCAWYSWLPYSVLSLCAF